MVESRTPIGLDKGIVLNRTRQPREPPAATHTRVSQHGKMSTDMLHELFICDYLLVTTYLTVLQKDPPIY